MPEEACRRTRVHRQMCTGRCDSYRASPLSSAANLFAAVSVVNLSPGSFALCALCLVPASYLQPWSAAGIAGGPSSGPAVAVSARMAAFALCTDTSGCCRVPSSLCGVVGFRPTLGRYWCVTCLVCVCLFVCLCVRVCLRVSVCACVVCRVSCVVCRVSCVV
jgi:hypothetical protein